MSLYSFSFPNMMNVLLEECLSLSGSTKTNICILILFVAYILSKFINSKSKMFACVLHKRVHMASTKTHYIYIWIYIIKENKATVDI